MQIRDRFNVELLHREYFTQEEYDMFLKENGLTVTDEYNKAKHQRKLKMSLLDVFRALINDTDSYKKMSDGVTQFSQSSAYKFLADRIQSLQEEISMLPIDEDEDVNSNVFILFKRGR